MELKTVTQKTLERINAYKQLHVGCVFVNTPYFNNKRSKVRGALRVLIGKGTPKELEQEAKIVALKKHIDLGTLTEKQAKEFLVEHNLGIDCSGLTYHLLDTELKTRKGISLKNKLTFQGGGLFRKLIRKIRTVENVNVRVFVHEKNSTAIELKNIKPADLIVRLGSGSGVDRDHILFIDSVVYKDNVPVEIHYTHTAQLTSDGMYGHGVRSGVIKITDPKKDVLDQQWIEEEKTGKQNETFTKAQHAEKVELRRINA